jgi:hypothetical protein
MGNLIGSRINDTAVIQVQLEELRKQNESLIKINEDLRKEQHSNYLKTRISNPLPANTAISMVMIREYVKEMLEKEECNISYMPDFVEKRLYEKIFTMLMGVIEYALETSSVNFMGHQIRFFLTETKVVDDIIKEELPNSNTNNINNTTMVSQELPPPKLSVAEACTPHTSCDNVTPKQ